MPWEETDQYVRSGHRSPEDFQPDSLRTIVLSESEGIRAVVGKLKGKDTMEIQSYLFDRSKGWTVEKAKKKGLDRRLENFLGYFGISAKEKSIKIPLHSKLLRSNLTLN